MKEVRAKTEATHQDDPARREIRPKREETNRQRQESDNGEREHPGIARKDPGPKREDVNEQDDRIANDEERIRKLRHHPFAQSALDQEQPEIEPDQPADIPDRRVFGVVRVHSPVKDRIAARTFSP